jgi:hypothetical protein
MRVLLSGPLGLRHGTPDAHDERVTTVASRSSDPAAGCKFESLLGRREARFANLVNR